MEKTEKERPKVGIGVLVVRDGKILLGERMNSHGAGNYALPGGHQEYGETFEQTSLREIEEETGLQDVTIERLISLSNDIAYDKHYISIGMLATLKSGEPIVAEPDKCLKWCWFDPHHLPENIFLPSKKVIKNWLAGTIYTP